VISATDISSEEQQVMSHWLESRSMKTVTTRELKACRGADTARYQGTAGQNARLHQGVRPGSGSHWLPSGLRGNDEQFISGCQRIADAAGYGSEKWLSAPLRIAGTEPRGNADAAGLSLEELHYLSGSEVSIISVGINHGNLVRMLQQAGRNRNDSSVSIGRWRWAAPLN
jgi:hypothetical protein